MYVSEELKNAEKYGYKFEILSGYLFTSDDLFSKYINILYHFKENSDKSSAMYLIAKLLMNSLYGRFGLNPSLKKYFITKISDRSTLINKESPANLEENIDLGEFSMCTFTHSNNNKNNNSNVAIASFVTAYARVAMSKFMNREDINLLYTDTDSIIVSDYLDDELVHPTKLGYMKLESEFSIFLSIGPKTYFGLSSNDGSTTCKLKGSKNKISFLEYLFLLQEDSHLKIFQEKWNKSFETSSIHIKNTPFTIRANNNKRLLIYSNGVLIGTANLII